MNNFRDGELTTLAKCLNLSSKSPDCRGSGQDGPHTCLLCLSFPTPRLMLEFDLLIFSFGQLPLALVTWVPMFLSTLLLPYQVLRLWARPQSRVAWTLGVGLGCMLLAGHTAVLSILPIHVAVEYQLPPASRCVLVFEQVGDGRDQWWAGPLGRRALDTVLVGAELLTRGGVLCEGFEPTSRLQGNVNERTDTAMQI